MIIKLLIEHHLEFLSLKRRLQRLVRDYNCQNATLLEITCRGSNLEKILSKQRVKMILLSWLYVLCLIDVLCYFINNILLSFQPFLYKTYVSQDFLRSASRDTILSFPLLYKMDTALEHQIFNLEK